MTSMTIATPIPINRKELSLKMGKELEGFYLTCSKKSPTLSMESKVKKSDFWIDFDWLPLPFVDTNDGLSESEMELLGEGHYYAYYLNYHSADQQVLLDIISIFESLYPGTQIITEDGYIGAAEMYLHQPEKTKERIETIQSIDEIENELSAMIQAGKDTTFSCDVTTNQDIGAKLRDVLKMELAYFDQWSKDDDGGFEVSSYMDDLVASDLHSRADQSGHHLAIRFGTIACAKRVLKTIARHFDIEFLETSIGFQGSLEAFLNLDSLLWEKKHLGLLKQKAHPEE